MKLETGYNSSFVIRERVYDWPAGKGFTILYLSDLHLNKHSADLVLKLIDAMDRLQPAIILLGGDYVDSEKGYSHFKTLLAALSKHKHVLAVAGNHDHMFGIDKIKKVITGCGIVWIERSSFIIDLDGSKIQVDGNIFSQEINNADFSIACMHKPVDMAPYKANYNLAFAGHLHGCQFVLWQKGNALYPGRIFYKWNVLEKQLCNCLYLISRGLGDTLPVRLNCEKEILMVTVIQKITL